MRSASTAVVSALLVLLSVTQDANGAVQASHSLRITFERAGEIPSAVGLDDVFQDDAGDAAEVEVAVIALPVIPLERIDLRSVGEFELQTTVLSFSPGNRNRRLVASMDGGLPPGVTLSLEVGGGSQVGLGDGPADLASFIGAGTGETTISLTLRARVDPEAAGEEGFAFDDGPLVIVFTLIDTA